MKEISVAFLAFFAASIGSVLGVGGGFIFIPVSTNLLGFGPNMAVPASLSMVLSNAVSATWTRASKNQLKVREHFWLGFGAVPSAVLGSFVGVRIESLLFKQLFGIFLILASLLMRLRSREPRPPHALREQMFRKALTVFVAGFISALLGVGGGILMVPFFMLWSRLGPHESVGLSQFVTAFSAATGIIAYISQGFFEPMLFLGAAAAGFLGGFVGSRIEIGMSEKGLQSVIAWGFMLIGVWMISSTFL